MFIKLNRARKRGQSTLEYGILISVVVAALLAMSIYLKRGLQGKLRETADDFGEGYSPGKTTGEITKTWDYQGSEKTEDGETETKINQDVRTKTGEETVAKEEDEYWYEP